MFLEERLDKYISGHIDNFMQDEVPSNPFKSFIDPIVVHEYENEVEFEFKGIKVTCRIITFEKHDALHSKKIASHTFYVGSMPKKLVNLHEESKKKIVRNQNRSRRASELYKMISGKHWLSTRNATLWSAYLQGSPDEKSRLREVIVSNNY